MRLEKIGNIKANPNNPRIIKDDKFKKLVKSIKEFPEMLNIRPIVVDSEMMVLGGNQRLKACIEAGLKEVPIIVADAFSEDQKKEFIVKDNIGYGEWDFDLLKVDYDVIVLEEWGLDIHESIEDEDGVEYSEEYGEDFSLPDGDKAPFQQMTFTLADEQAIQIKNAIADIKKTQEYKYSETMGNENSNGNALYLIIMQWAEQKK